MKLQIIGKNFPLNQRIKTVIGRKMEDSLEDILQEFNNDIKKAFVKIEKRTRWGYQINFSMWLPGKRHIFAEEVGKTMFFTITSLRQKIQREIKKIGRKRPK